MGAGSAPRRPRRGPSGIGGSVFLFVLAFVTASSGSAGTCQLSRVGELAVTMSGLRPMVHAKINGTDALFVADSGAFYNMLTPVAAAAFKLPFRPLPPYFSLRGVGGEARVYLTTVRTFTIFNMQISDVPFLVAGNDLGGGAVGLLGQNLFHIADVEYDLANGAIRLIRPHECKSSVLAYWAGAEQKPYSLIDIESTDPLAPHTRSEAYLNGKKIRVLFDTGAATSVLSLDAAKRAGVTPQSTGVLPGGSWMGIGRRLGETWIAPFASFKIGDEEVRNTRLRIGEIELNDVDMLIGADFFLSHRVYVASSQRKLYFTYNGGPVFNLTRAPAAGGPTADSESSPAAPPPDQTGDAAALARRGAALTARRDYEHAIADLTRACELAPEEASNRYLRGMALWSNGQADLALADFDAAIKLKPDDVPSLLSRATLRAHRGERDAALAADLATADRAAPKQAYERLRLAEIYFYTGEFGAAVAQYSKWIETHERDEAQMAQILNERCWSRALWGAELEQALVDCGGALKLRPKTAAFLDSRGLVHLRLNHYDQAIADYEAALRLQPKDAWSLYGRGLARLHKGQTAEARADLAAAAALKPDIATEAGRYGITE